MQNKYSINLSIFIPRFINRVVIIIIITVLSMLIWKKSKAQIIQLERIKEQKRLVKQTPQLKEQLRILRILEKMEEVSNDMESRELNIKIVLNGIFIKDRMPVALINDKTYQVGDNVGNFIITRISINKTALPYIVVKDKDTNQKKKLYLYLAPQ